MTIDVTSWGLCLLSDRHPPTPNQLPLGLALPWEPFPVLGSLYSKIPGGSVLARHVASVWAGKLNILLGLWKEGMA